MSKQSYKKEFFTVFLIVATELIGFGLIIPILPQIALKFEIGGFFIGVLLASYSFAQFIANPILGGLSDRFGRKPILLISKLGTVLSYVLLAYSNSYALFLCARLLDGFTGGNIAVARAYLTDITAPEDRAKGMAIIGISFGVGFILGPAIGAFLFGVSDNHFLPALVAGTLSLFAFFLTLVLLKEPSNHKERGPQIAFMKQIKILFKVPPLRIILLVQLAFMLIFSSFETTFSIFTHAIYQFTEQDNSVLFLYLGLLALFIQGGIMRRPFKNLKQAICLGLLATAISFLILSTVKSILFLWIGLAFMAFGVGCIQTHLPALLSVNTSGHVTGQVMGVYEAIGSLSRIIGPLLVYMSFFHELRVGYFFFFVLLFGLAGSVLVFFKKTVET